MRYIERYLLRLLEMKSTVFYRFFDQCCVKFQFRMPGSLLSRVAVYLRKQTQYINQAKFMQTFQYQVEENSSTFWKTMCCCQRMQRRWCCTRKKPTQIQEQDNTEAAQSNAIANSKGSPTQYNDNSLSDEEKEEEFDLFRFAMNKQVKEEKKTQINFYSYEFDHIIKGD